MSHCSIVIKYSAAGVQQWMDHYDEMPEVAGTGDSIDFAYDLAVDGTGRVYVVGLLNVDWEGVSVDETYDIITYSNTGAVIDVQYAGIGAGSDPAPFLNLGRKRRVNSSRQVPEALSG